MLGGFASLITTIVVCAVLRAVIDIMLPEGNMKSITDVGTNIIIVAVIFNAVIDLIKNIFL